MSRAGQASRGGCPGRREQPAQRPGEDAHHVQEARSLLSHPAQSGFHPRALGSHSRFWTRKSGSLSSVDFQRTFRVPGGDVGGQRAGRGPHGREGGPGEECFLSPLLRFASQMPSRELPMADGLRRRRAWPAAPRGQRVRAALGDPTPADQPGLWWLESHGDGPGLRGGSQGRASPLARSSGEPSCSCCVLNLGDIRLQTHTCSPNHRLRHPESQVCPLQVTAARGTEARPPPRAPASYSPVRSSGIRCL